MKKNRKCPVLFIILLVMTCIISGCGSREISREESVSQEEDKIQIGMSFDSFVIERWQRDRDVFVSMAKEMGAEVNVQNANGDLEEQKKQIDYFIQKDMDVIVIICTSGVQLFFSSCVGYAPQTAKRINAYKSCAVPMSSPANHFFDKPI